MIIIPPSEYNSRMRAAAGSNKFLVQLWKDFNNVLFGKVRAYKSFIKKFGKVPY